MPDPVTVRESLVEDPRQSELAELEADLLPDLAAESVRCRLPLPEPAARRDPPVRPRRGRGVPDKEDAESGIVHKTCGGPQGCVVRSTERGMACVHREGSLDDRHASVRRERAREPTPARPDH